MVYYKGLRFIGVVIFIIAGIPLFFMKPSSNSIVNIFFTIGLLLVLLWVENYIINIITYRLHKTQHDLFLETCDTDRYMNYLIKHQKPSKYHTNPSIALSLSFLYILKSDCNSAEKELIECDQNMDMDKNPVSKSLYFRTWIQLYLLLNQPHKAQEMLYEMNKCTNTIKSNADRKIFIDRFHEANYLVQFANGNSNDDAILFFYSRMEKSTTQFDKIRQSFFLAVAYDVNHQQEKARPLLMYVIENSSNLCYCDFAKKLIEI